MRIWWVRPVSSRQATRVAAAPEALKDLVVGDRRHTLPDRAGDPAAAVTAVGHQRQVDLAATARHRPLDDRQVASLDGVSRNNAWNGRNALGEQTTIMTPEVSRSSRCTIPT